MTRFRQNEWYITVMHVFSFSFQPTGISVKGRGAAPLAEDETKTFDADTGKL